MSKYHPAVLIAALAALLTGCAAPTPVIDKARFARPVTVAIVEPPPMRNHALVGMHVLPNWFAHPRHFSPQFDHYFVTTGPATLPGAPAMQKPAAGEVALAIMPATPAMQSVAGAGAAGAVAGMLQAGEEISAKKAMQYDQDVRARMPDFDLRKDIVQSLVSALQQRGATVSLIQADASTGPRLRWLAKGHEGFAQAASADAPAVDADLVLQLSPVAHWVAPGFMNNFQRTGNIGVVIYNGRTREYLGTQSFFYDSPAFQQQYARYDTLVADTPGATSAMREGMLTLVPQIADAVLAPGAQSGR